MTSQNGWSLLLEENVALVCRDSSVLGVDNSWNVFNLDSMYYPSTIMLSQGFDFQFVDQRIDLRLYTLFSVEMTMNRVKEAPVGLTVDELLT